MLGSSFTMVSTVHSNNGNGEASLFHTYAAPVTAKQREDRIATVADAEKSRPTKNGGITVAFGKNSTAFSNWT